MASKGLSDIIGEVESLLRLREIGSHSDKTDSEYFVASLKRNTFPRLSCDYASHVMLSSSFLVFYSHDEAADAGYKPCGTGGA